MHKCEHCGAVKSSVKLPGRMDEIPGNEHVKRALEVALVGGHSITFFGADAQLNEAFANIATAHGLSARIEKPCPCGNYNDRSWWCSCHGDDIVEYTGRDLFIEALRADIIAKPITPGADEHRRKEMGRIERDSIILGRVEIAKQFAHVDQALDDTCKRLRRSAMTQMDLTQQAWSQVMAVATSISKLAGDDTIQAYGLAEALQYR